MIKGGSAGSGPLLGIVPSLRLAFATDASNADTVTINGNVFKFLTTLITADTTTQIKRGTSAAVTLGLLVKAINGTVDADIVLATTPFTDSIVADAVGTSLRIRKADAQGGSPVAGVSTSYAVSETLTPAGDIWSAANLSVSGKAATDSQQTVGSVAITAAMVTNGSFQVELPFTPTVVLWDGYASTGIKRAINEAVTISSNAINLALAGGGSPNWQAGDFFRFIANS